VTLGVVVGLFASIVLSEAGDVISKAALWIGIGAGFVVAVILWIRARQGAP
ncbi:MAG: hypothetical protein QOF01_4907, partial [Thermomicrobiales bacterium]|nr:hypothetical protein [Thermomicrobiales bacterium]